MSEQLDYLTQQIADMKNTVDSAVTLIEVLADKIEQSQNDPAALQALADDLRSQRVALGNAVASHDDDPETSPEE